MAKKRQNSSRRTSTVDTLPSKLEGVFKNPAVKYIATEMATAALAKLFKTLSKRYPELTHILSDGLDSIEGKLIDFKNNKGERNLQH